MIRNDLTQLALGGDLRKLIALVTYEIIYKPVVEDCFSNREPPSDISPDFWKKKLR